MTFQVLDKSTITIEDAVDDEDEFETIQLTIFNDGNVEDNIIVELVNYDELDDLGVGYAFFSESPLYVGVDSYRESVAPGATSNAGKMIFGIDKLPDEDISFEIELLAYSLNDDAEPVKVTADVVITGGGSSALGLDSVSSSDLKLIGMAGGGLIGVIVLLVMISRLTKKATGKQKVAAKEAKKAAKIQRKGRKTKKAKVVEEEYDDDDDFDFDDFDDDFDFEDL